MIKIAQITSIVLASLVVVVANAASQTSYRENGELVCSGNQMAMSLNKQYIEATNRSWAQLDADTRSCVASHVGSIAQLVARCIGADDRRVAPYVQNCQQTIASARRAQEQAAASARRAQEQAAASARQAQEAEARRVNAQNEAREKERQATALAKEKEETRRRELIAKYGEESALAIIARKILKGMSGEEVLAARGSPQRKENIPPHYELWIYPDARISLANGKVENIGLLEVPSDGRIDGKVANTALLEVPSDGQVKGELSGSKVCDLVPKAEIEDKTGRKIYKYLVSKRTESLVSCTVIFEGSDRINAEFVLGKASTEDEFNRLLRANLTYEPGAIAKRYIGWVEYQVGGNRSKTLPDKNLDVMLQRIMLGTFLNRWKKYDESK